MQKTSFGFTLIELLVVVSIIGILAVSGLSIFNNARMKTRDSTRLIDMRNLLSITEQITMDQLGGDSYLLDEETIVDGEDCLRGYPYSGEYAYLAEKLQKLQYIDIMPEDPLNIEEYVYRYTSNEDCTAFEYSIRFEHDANIQKTKSDNGDDGNRYEVGTINCLNKNNSENCNLGEGINTQLEKTNIEYKKDILEQMTGYFVSIF